MKPCYEESFAASVCATGRPARLERHSTLRRGQAQDDRQDQLEPLAQFELDAAGASALSADGGRERVVYGTRAATKASGGLAAG